MEPKQCPCVKPTQCPCVWAHTVAVRAARGGRSRELQPHWPEPQPTPNHPNLAPNGSPSHHFQHGPHPRTQNFGADLAVIVPPPQSQLFSTIFEPKIGFSAENSISENGFSAESSAQSGLGPQGPHGAPRGPMGPHGAPWGPTGPHGAPWGSKGPHGAPWASLGPQGAPGAPEHPALAGCLGPRGPRTSCLRQKSTELAHAANPALQ